MDIFLKNNLTNKKRVLVSVPMAGVQTLGGVFIRKMIINSREAASVTEMYSAASCQLTKTNSDAASGSLDVGVQFGGGVVEAG